MGDSQPITPKYVIKASFRVDGVVEKSDVIGAIFGQTEGLFGPDLDLHALQKSGRIGRIEIRMRAEQDQTRGTIIIPSSLDKPITALTAAAVESVNRIGPCSARVKLGNIEDVREAKRSKIISRAQEILKKWIIESTPTIEQLTDEVVEAIKVGQIVSYGPDKLAAGPGISSSRSIIIVEGRADVAVLLKAGLNNVIACEGTKIPKTIISLSRDKGVTAFLDGDRGGDLILKELLQVAEVDYVARAPRGKEVEDLTPKQALEALKEKITVKRIEDKTSKREADEKRATSLPEPVVSVASKLQGTLEAILLNQKYDTIKQVPVSDLCSTLQKTEEVHTIVFDGVITQRLVDISGEKGVKLILGDRVSGVVKRPLDVQLLTTSDVFKGKRD